MGAVIVNLLCAGMTFIDIIQCHKIKLSTVYEGKNRLAAFVTAGGSHGSLSIERKKNNR